MKFRRILSSGNLQYQTLNETDEWEPTDVAPLPSAFTPEFEVARAQAHAAAGGGCLPFQPLSFRDFMASRQHVIDASRGLLTRFHPREAAVTRAVESLTHKPFPKFAPHPLFDEQPIYYMSNHLTFVPSGTPVRAPAYTRALDYELELGFVLRTMSSTTEGFSFRNVSPNRNGAVRSPRKRPSTSLHSSSNQRWTRRLRGVCSAELHSITSLSACGLWVAAAHSATLPPSDAPTRATGFGKVAATASTSWAACAKSNMPPGSSLLGGSPTGSTAQHVKPARAKRRGSVPNKRAPEPSPGTSTTPGPSPSRVWWTRRPLRSTVGIAAV